VKSPPRSLSASATTPNMLSRVPSAPATLSPAPMGMSSMGGITLVAGASTLAGVNQTGSAVSPSAQVRQARSPTLVRKARSPRSVSPVMSTVRVGQEGPPRGLSPVTVIAREGTVSPLPLPVPTAAGTPAAQVRARSPRGPHQRVSPGPPQCSSPSQQQRRSPRVQGPRMDGSRVVQRSLPSYAWSPRSGSLSANSSIAVPVQNGIVNAPQAGAPNLGPPVGNAQLLSAVSVSTAAVQGVALGSAVVPGGPLATNGVAKGTASGPVAPSAAGVAAAGLTDPRFAAWSGTRSPRPSPKATPRPASTTTSLAGASAARPAPVQPPRTERSPRQPRGTTGGGLSGSAGLRRVSPSTRPIVRPPAGGSHAVPME